MITIGYIVICWTLVERYCHNCGGHLDWHNLLKCVSPKIAKAYHSANYNEQKSTIALLNEIFREEP